MRRSLALVILALALTPAAALGHSNSVETNPEHGAELATLPPEATVTFGEAPTQADVALSMPDGTIQALGARIEGATVVVELPSDGPRGNYGLSYRVVSADGHAVSGSMTFTITTGPKPAARPQPTSSPAGDTDRGRTERGFSMPGIAVFGFAVMALTTLVLLAARARRL